jgi:sugar lactone lactonase YvrE
MERMIDPQLLVAMVCLLYAGVARAELMRGEVENVLLLSDGVSPEGIALDRADGAIFIGIRRPDGDLLRNEILRLDAQGQLAQYSILPQTPVDPFGRGESGVLGLVTDRDGAIFAALMSPDPNIRGVYKITDDGSHAQRLPGSGSMLYPNALTFDSRGNLYVSDSLGGSVWRFNPDDVNHAGELWVQHELLAPSPLDPLGAPVGGANGIAYFPDTLYVANTEKGIIAGIPINLDGTPNTPTLVAGDTPYGQLISIDGIAMDANGNIHAVMPTYEAASLVIPPVLQPAGGYAPLVQVNPNTGEIIPTVFDNSIEPNFDVPLSLAFGSLEENVTTVFITNGALSAAQGVPGPGPRLVQVGIGVPGFIIVPEPSSHFALGAMILAVTLLRRIPNYPRLMRRSSAMPHRCRRIRRAFEQPNARDAS